MTGAALVLHQFRFEQKVFWRSPPAVFFTVMFPVIFLIIFSSLFGDGTIDELGIKTSTYYVPGIITLAVVSATLGARSGSRAARRPWRVSGGYPAGWGGLKEPEWWGVSPAIAWGR